MRPDNDTPEQPEQQQSEQSMPERKQPRQETPEQEPQEQNPTARQQAEAVAAPHRAVAPSATLPVTQAEASTSPDICARLQPELKAYQDGQVGWWQRREIGRHLTRCAVCREEIEAMREFSDKWRGADAEVLDAGLRARILAAVPDTRPLASAVTPSRRRPLSLALAGAGICALLGGIALYPVVMSKTNRAMQSEATRTLSAPSAAVLADAGQAQNRSQSYATAGAATNGNAASTIAPVGNAAAPAAPASAANPAGTQIADAHQSPLDQDGSAPGEPGRTTRNKEASGPATSSQIQSNASKEAYSKSTDTAMGATSPPPPAAAREAAADNAPVMADAAGGSQTTSHTMSKASAPTFPPSPTPSNKTANVAGTEAASRPRRTDYNQTAGSTAQSRPDPEKQSDDGAKTASPAEIIAEPRAGKTAMRHNKASRTSGGAAKVVASQPVIPSPARLTTTERASRQEADADTPVVTLKIRVAQMEIADADIERKARALGGTVVTSETTTDVGGAKSAMLRLKVPPANLDTFLAQTAQTGTVLSKTVPAMRSEAADTVTRGHSRAFAARKESRAQMTYVNITVVLQGQ